MTSDAHGSIAGKESGPVPGGEEAGGPWYQKLHWQILIALVAGTCTGAVFGEPASELVGWLGTLFVKLLKMVVVPLVLASIVSGVASVGSTAALGRLFGKTLGFYLTSSLLAILLGLVLVNLLEPGRGLDLSRLAAAQLPEGVQAPRGVADLLLSMVPDNPVAAAARADLLALIVFSILLGVAASGISLERRRSFVGFFESLFEVMLRLTRMVLRLAPLGVFGLIVRAVATFGLGAFRTMGLYMLTVALGLLLHFLVTLPVLLWLLGRIPARVHYRNLFEPMTIAFSTSSSAATLPSTMAAVEQRCGVSRRVSSFVLPMGATVNMDGTALYECAGALFIAQALGVELSWLQQGIVVLTALLASIGAAAIPSAGLVVIFMVLEAVGLRGPAVEALVGFMLAVDRPLDMFRTVVNVTSDTCAAVIVAKSEGETVCGESVS